MKIKLLTKTATIPTRATPFSAGYDLYADEDVKVYPGEWEMVSTGIACNIPEQFFGAIYPRSGLATKSGLVLRNTVGIIDADYNKEIKVCLMNIGVDVAKIERGVRIAQMVLQPYHVTDIMVVDELESRSDRSGGFGSTGVK